MTMKYLYSPEVILSISSQRYLFRYSQRFYECIREVKDDKIITFWTYQSGKWTEYPKESYDNVVFPPDGTEITESKVREILFLDKL